MARLYTRLVYAWWFWRPSLVTLWVTFRQLNVAERAPVSRERAHAYTTFGTSLSAMLPVFHRRGCLFTARGRALFEELGDLWGQGNAAGFHAVALHAAGRYPEVIATCDEAIALLDRTGDPWERNAALWHKALASYRVGKLAAAISVCQALDQDSLRLGDTLYRGIALGICSKAGSGAVPAESIASALERAAGDVVPISELLQGDAVRLLAEGRAREAIDRLEEAVELMRRSRQYNMYVVSARTWLGTAYRQAAELAPPLAPATRRRLLRRAARSTRRAARYARVWPHERPHALREAGLVAALRNRPRRARRFLNRALAAAADQGMHAEWADTLAARARVGLLAGWPDAAEDFTEAQEARRHLEPQLRVAAEQRTTIDLADRYSTLLDAGRRITGAATLDELVAVITETAAALLRAERCTLLHIGGESRLIPPANDREADPATRLLVQRTMSERRPLVLSDVDNDDVSNENPSLANDFRSVLCAPILVHGQIAACLIATHRHVAGLFGEDEVQLVDLIAGLAGAALEREQLQQETRRLVIGAQEEERARIARDLHDEIGQALTSVLVGLRRVQTSLPNGAPETLAARQRMHEAHRAATDALDQVKQLASELRPSVLDDVGLVAAVHRIADDIGARHDLTVDVVTRGIDVEEREDPQIETTAYRVVQEALTNVVRHARAGNCSVILARHRQNLRVVIEDDGAGFDPANIRIGALGLRGMAERAALVGGKLQVSSSPGEGTTIALDLPLMKIVDD